MMYLKFVGKTNDDHLSRVISTSKYDVTKYGSSIRVYDCATGVYETVSKNDWLQCFVVGSEGSTIDVIRRVD